MATQQTFSTGDLRSNAQDYKRDSELKHKWERGQVWTAGRQHPDHARPARVLPKLKQSNRTMGISSAKVVNRHEMAEGQDSSADEDVLEPSAAPEPDAEIAYSYDAARGPSHGSQVLGDALAKAVERYENTVTDKIVKEEYEVLDVDGEIIAGKAAKKAAKVASAPDEEDEYEFV